MKSEFKLIFDDTKYHDKLYLFLQNIFNVVPEDKFFNLIKDNAQEFSDDLEIYQSIQNNLSKIKPFMVDLRYSIPALFKQKKMIAAQTQQLLANNLNINGYLEIGTVGRYIPNLSKHLNLSGELYILNDKPAGYSPLDILDRGSITIKTKFINLANYEPFTLPTDSLDLITCYIGLHHAPLDRLNGFIQSIYSALKPGARFVLRDHNCNSEKMTTFVSLIHSVFNIGSGVNVEDNQKELRFFRPLHEWVEILASHGLYHRDNPIYQDHDPSDNGLMLFVKQ